MIDLEIWSDFMCPFCYIGKRKFENALNQFEAKDQVNIIWKSYQLDPSLQSNKYTSINEYLAIAKKVPHDEAAQINNYVKTLAEKVGLNYNLENIKVVNTLKAHQLSQLSKIFGKQNEVEEALFKAYFIDGKNLDDINTLVEIGINNGIEKQQIENTYKENKFIKEIDKDIEDSKNLGLTGVPFFVFNNKYGISGAQESDVFLESLEKILRDSKIQLAKGGIQCDINSVCK